MTRAPNKNLLKVIEMTKEMLALADEGDRDRDDANCGILYGILRDMAYKLRNLSTQECQRHKKADKLD